MVSSTYAVEIVLAAFAVLAAMSAVAISLSVRAKDAKTGEALETIRGLIQRQGPQLSAAHVEGESSPLHPRRSYIMQTPSAPALPAAPPAVEPPSVSVVERDARQDIALTVRGIAQDIGVLSDAYCAGPNNDAPDPEKLGHVLGRWEDRLMAVVDELDGEDLAAPDVEDAAVEASDAHGCPPEA
jgi:hypothetical protein